MRNLLNVFKRNVFYVVLTLLLFSGCRTVIVPYSTSVEKISKLSVGMEKSQVPQVLGVHPYDIYVNSNTGCEIHQYFYRSKEREHSSKQQTTKEGLTDGQIKYTTDNDLFLIFRGKKLETVITGRGLEDGYYNLYFNGQTKEECDNEKYNYTVHEQKVDTVIKSKCEYCDLIREIVNKGGGNVTISLPAPYEVFSDKNESLSKGPIKNKTKKKNQKKLIN